MILFRFLLISTIVFSAIIFITYQLGQFLMGSQSAKRKLEKDLDDLQVVLNEFVDGLVYLDIEELKIMSVNTVDKLVGKGLSTYNKGVISTIYQEPIVAYAMKVYEKWDKMLLVARTKDDIFSIQSEGEKFKVFKNNQAFGTIEDDYTFYYSGAAVPEVSLDHINGQRISKLIKDNKEIAHINMRDESLKFDTDRIFSLFHDVKPGYEDTLLIIALFHILVKSKIGK